MKYRSCMLTYQLVSILNLLQGSRRLAVTSLAVLVVLLVSLPWALADTSPPSEEWSTTFGGSNYDVGRSVQQTSDGGYILTGYSGSFGAPGWNVYLVKTNSTGGMEWNRTLGGSGGDVGYSVQQTSDGGYILTGYSASFGAYLYDAYLVKLNSTGLEEWSTTFGGYFGDVGRSVQQTSDGGYIIAGETSSFGAGGTDVYLVKTNSTGGMEWNTTFGGFEDDIGYSVKETSDGGYILTGETSSFGAGEADVYLVKTNSTGGMEWNRTFGGPSGDKGFSVQETSDGGYILTGQSDLFQTNWEDVYLVKTNSTGGMEWSRTFGGSSVDSGESVQETSDGGYIIAGYTYPLGAGASDVYLVKTNST